MAGRPRKPTAIKILDGTARRDLRNETEPQPPVGIAPPSSWLDNAAKRYYCDLAEKLIAIGLLTTIDQTILELHSQAYADVARLTREIRREGEVKTERNKGGQEYTARNPKTTILQEAKKVLRDTARDMGLTPEVRSKLHVTPQVEKPGDSLLGFIDSIKR
jgi:P27 family predicted phage terminase small subunit